MLTKHNINERENIYTELFEKAGLYHQLEVFLQETCELIRSISEYLNYRDTVEEMISEIVDMYVCGEELLWYMNNNIFSKDEEVNFDNIVLHPKGCGNFVTKPCVEKWFEVRSMILDLQILLTEITMIKTETQREMSISRKIWKDFVISDYQVDHLHTELFSNRLVIKKYISGIIGRLQTICQIEKFDIKPEYDRKILRLKTKVESEIDL